MINRIVTALSKHFDSVSAGYIWFDEVSNFPSISVVLDSTRIKHLGGGVRQYISEVTIRGYTLDESVEDAGEDLAHKIEQILDSYRDNLIEDIRLQRIETDGGLHSPYGAVIINAQVIYVNHI
jgi:hypothetical protein